MADTIPVRIDPMDRQLLEGAAQLEGMKLSTWIRAAAIEKSRLKLGHWPREQSSGDSGG